MRKIRRETESLSISLVWVLLRCEERGTCPTWAVAELNPSSSTASMETQQHTGTGSCLFIAQPRKPRTACHCRSSLLWRLHKRGEGLPALKRGLYPALCRISAATKTPLAVVHAGKVGGTLVKRGWKGGSGELWEQVETALQWMHGRSKEKQA